MRSVEILIFVSLCALCIASSPAARTVDRDFPIALLSAEDAESGDSLKALVCAGIADGIDVGAEEAIWAMTGGKDLKLADVEVLEASAYESLCLIKNFRGRGISEFHRVAFELEHLDCEAHREKGLSAFDMGHFAHALYHLRNGMPSLSQVDERRSMISMMNECMRQIKERQEALLTDDSKKQFGKRKDIEFLMAQYHFSRGNLFASELYLAKMSVSDRRGRKEVRKLSTIISRAGEPEPGFCLDEPVDSAMATLEVYPEMIKSTAPEYPEEAWRARITGLVVVTASIDDKGNVRKAMVHESSGTASLDVAAVVAAYDNKFKPAIKNGQPTGCWVSYKVDFKL